MRRFVDLYIRYDTTFIMYEDCIRKRIDDILGVEIPFVCVCIIRIRLLSLAYLFSETPTHPTLMVHRWCRKELP